MTVIAHELIGSKYAGFCAVRYVSFGVLVNVRFGYSKVYQVYRVLRRLLERQRLFRSSD